MPCRQLPRSKGVFHRVVGALNLEIISINRKERQAGRSKVSLRGSSCLLLTFAVKTNV